MEQKLHRRDAWSRDTHSHTQHACPKIQFTRLHDTHTHTHTHALKHTQPSFPGPSSPFPHPPHVPAVSSLYILANRWRPCSLPLTSRGNRRMHYDSSVLEDSSRLRSVLQNWCSLPGRRSHVKFATSSPCAAPEPSWLPA